jgi:hypothetical protein
MLASRWREHQRFLPPAGEVKDNDVSAVELIGILHTNPKPQELRAFDCENCDRKMTMEYGIDREKLPKIAIGSNSKLGTPSAGKSQIARNSKLWPKNKIDARKIQDIC